MCCYDCSRTVRGFILLLAICQGSFLFGACGLSEALLSSRRTYLDYYRAVSCKIDALCSLNFASGLRVKSGYQTLILMSRSSEKLSESVTGRGSRTEFEFEFFLKHSILP